MFNTLSKFNLPLPKYGRLVEEQTNNAYICENQKVLGQISVKKYINIGGLKIIRK
jgi:hypothetical protein